jgi:hypothetical protein
MLFSLPSRAPDSRIAYRIRAFQSGLPSQTEIDTIFAKIEASDEVDRTQYSTLQRLLDKVQVKIESDLHASNWTHGHSDSLRPKPEETSEDDKTGLSPEEELIILQEEFIAYRDLTFMRYVFRHLRNLLGYVVTAFIITVVALSSYPFLGAHWLALSAIFVFLALGIGVVVVFAEMDRDAVLSRITDIRAGLYSYSTAAVCPAPGSISLNRHRRVQCSRPFPRAASEILAASHQLPPRFAPDGH